MSVRGGEAPLVDVASASALLARYAWAIDDGDYAALHDLFTPDVAADYGAFVCTDRADLVRRMEDLHRDLVATQHLVGSVMVEPVDSGAVRVSSHVRATLVRARGEGQRVEVAASYRDLVVPGASGPLIAVRRVEGRWIAGERSILPWFRGAARGDGRAVRPNQTSTAQESHTHD